MFKYIINPTVTALGRYDLILGKPWLTRVNPQPDWMFNTLTIQLPNGRYGVFQGITKTPTQEAHIAHLDVDTFKQAVNEGVGHFYGFLRPDQLQNMALYGPTLQSIPLSDPLPSKTSTPSDPTWTSREPTHHIVDTLPSAFSAIGPSLRAGSLISRRKPRKQPDQELECIKSHRRGKIRNRPLYRFEKVL
jgi:hypothetical protein